MYFSVLQTQKTPWTFQVSWGIVSRLLAVSKVNDPGHTLLFSNEVSNSPLDVIINSCEVGEGSSDAEIFYSSLLTLHVYSQDSCHCWMVKCIQFVEVLFWKIPWFGSQKCNHQPSMYNKALAPRLMSLPLKKCFMVPSMPRALIILVWISKIFFEHVLNIST